MKKHAFVVCALIAALAVLPGCSRLARTALRGNRTGSSYGSRQPKPEDMRISIADLDAASVKILNQQRAKWSEYVQKYNAGDVIGKAQVLAVMEAVTAAHWSEKPKTEDLIEPLGVAIGDALKLEGNINWVLAEGDTVCLVSPNGKVAVAPVGIAEAWLGTQKYPMDTLIKDVAKAVRETTGEPVLIGFEIVEQSDPQLR